ncbi:uncharacterized protein HMPREF1541_03174 [Cyphellophora europaea CBS 101466]|uniref:Uncharacterized protein n=1 Tax=Cyphellophora europaea (strain CBS 101466) TaxID=1220924 RepID=W2RZW2_CYPE1|nr:uncharacterized protein HMPREF1541_03174 [Cyphellophora europaea CBS 101466]ETN41239.1 hypothetical protein HMPREF1541_03174 [Cyphellophora europaea CBS 101466]
MHHLYTDTTGSLTYRERDASRLSLLDLPSPIRERIYAYYFTYRDGLYLHLVYSGHFPRPRARHYSFRRANADPELVSPSSSPSAESNASDDDDEWPFPAEAPFKALTHFFSTVQRTPLQPEECSVCLSPTSTNFANDEWLAATTAVTDGGSPPLSPSSLDVVPLRVSTRQRLRTLHASLPPGLRAEAALLRVCRAVEAEARGAVWRCNVVHLVTDADACTEIVFDDMDEARDGVYHLHLGLVSAAVLEGIRVLSLPAEVVRALPARDDDPAVRMGWRTGGVLVQRRVWGAVQHQMIGLRKLEVGVVEVAEVASFLAWLGCHEGVVTGDVRVVLEGGALGRDDQSQRGGMVPASVGHCVPERRRSRSSADMVGMAMPGEVEEINIKVVLSKCLREEFENVRWGRCRAVEIGRRSGAACYHGREARWDAVEYELMNINAVDEDMQGRVHAQLRGMNLRNGDGVGAQTLGDRVYGKMRLLT